MVCSEKTVQKALRSIGFKPMRRGKATSHEYWHDQFGRTVQVVTSNGDVPDKYIYSMTNEMQWKGICQPRDFRTLLRNLRN
jgi:predicted RNA binding protein YcfA (HicA-like mRNA interferase family)